MKSKKKTLKKISTPTGNRTGALAGVIKMVITRKRLDQFKKSFGNNMHPPLAVAKKNFGCDLTKKLLNKVFEVT